MTIMTRLLSLVAARSGSDYSRVVIAIPLFTLGCIGSRDADSTFDPLPDLSAVIDAAGSSDGSVTLPPDGDATSVLSDTTPSTGFGLRINEVAAAGSPEDWVELINLSRVPLSLDGYALADSTGGTPVPLQNGLVIAPGGLLVIEITELAFGFKIGSDEALFLYDPSSAAIDSADWAEGESPEGGSFARVPNGTGTFTTAVPDTRGEANDGVVTPPSDVVNPDASAAPDTPGEADVAAPDSGGDDEVAAPDTNGDDDGVPSIDAGAGDPAAIVINEVTSSGSDEIELLNMGTSTVDLSGWALVDDGYLGDPADTEHRYDFPALSQLGPGKYLVLEGGVDHPFGVGKSDVLRLLAPDDVVADETSWTDPAAAVSWCRMPNGTGPFEACDIATFGVSNGGQPLPGVLALNEVTSSGDDLIELINLGPGVAVVAGHAVSDDGYDPADPETVALHFTVLSSPAVLAAGERLVLTKGVDHVFGLAKTDSVTLWSPEGGIVDTTAWQDPNAEVSWCRSPDASGTFAACSVATLGTENP